jgi:anaerobic selenocysteine-containing dehydrogenase
VLIHPREAGVRGIRQVYLVRVFNDRGEFCLYAKVSPDTQPGLLVAEGLHWPRFAPGGQGANQLTSQRLTDQGETCAFHCSLVEVEEGGYASNDSSGLGAAESSTALV